MKYIDAETKPKLSDEEPIRVTLLRQGFTKTVHNQFRHDHAAIRRRLANSQLELIHHNLSSIQLSHPPESSGL